MKTIFLVLLSIALSVAASAQRKSNSDEHHEYSEERNEYSQRGVQVYSLPLTYGLGYDYPYYGNPYYGYYGYGYGYPLWYRPFHSRSRANQYKLDLQLKAIRMDYANRIKEARHDKSLSHSQKKEKIHSLKDERNDEIVNAEKNFAKQLNMGNQNPRMRNNRRPANTNAVS